MALPANRINYCPNPGFEGISTTTWINLATNPGMEATSSTVATRTNLAPNPSFVTDINNIGSYGTGAPVLSWQSGAGAVGNGFARQTYGGTATLGDGGFFGEDIAVAVGDVVTESLWVRASVSTRVSVGVEWRTASASISQVFGTEVILTANTWTSISVVGMTAPSTAVIARLIVGARTGTGSVAWTAGNTFDADGVLIEKSPALGTYFDGSTAAAGDFTYAWTGTANASSSVRNAPGINTFVPAGGAMTWSSTAQKLVGTRSAAVDWTNAPLNTSVGSTISGLVNGTTYKVTLAGYAPTGAPDWKVGVTTGPTYSSVVTTKNAWTTATFTFTASGTTATFGVWNNTAGTAGVAVYFDSFLIEVNTGNSGLTYFDGATTDAGGNYTYAWTGTANASTSTRSITAPTGWTAENGGLITASTTTPIAGTRSGRLSTGGDAYFQVSGTPAAGDYWTFSVAYKTSGTVAGTPKITLAQVGGTGPTGTTNLPLTLATAGRYSVTIGPLTAGVTAVTAAINAPTSGGVVFFDQAQLEKGQAATTYFDGATAPDTNGYYFWTGTANASTSQAEYRGVWVEQRTGSGAPSAQVTVSGLGPTAGTVQVTRTADGETWTVPGWYNRSVVDTDTDPDFVVPLGRPVTYTLFFNGAQIAQQTITITSTTGWIQSPYDPTSAMPINTLMTDPAVLTLAKGSLDSRTHASNSSRAVAMGSKRPYSVGGQRMADAAASFIFHAWKNSTSDQFKAMIAQAPVLLVRGLPSWGSIPGLAYLDAPAQEHDISRYKNYPRDGLTQWLLAGDLVQPVSRKTITGTITNDQVQTNLAGTTYATILARSGSKKNVDIKANPLGL